MQQSSSSFFEQYDFICFNISKPQLYKCPFGGDFTLGKFISWLIPQLH
jgi:hypothetical protein